MAYCLSRLLIGYGSYEHAIVVWWVGTSICYVKRTTPTLLLLGQSVVEFHMP